MLFESQSVNTPRTGMVVRKNRGQYMVRSDGDSIPCAISSRLRKTLIYPTAAPSSLHHRVQIVDDIEVEDPIAAGDQVVIVFAAANPEPKWNLLDRYLVTAEAAGLPAVICMTKLDLAHLPALERELDLYRRLGDTILLTSANRGDGIQAARAVPRDAFLPERLPVPIQLPARARTWLRRPQGSHSGLHRPAPLPELSETVGGMSG